MQLTETRDLRGGRTCWLAMEKHAIASDFIADEPFDVAIVGAGIMGAMLAERLAGDGRRVAVVDRRPPAHGSTAASTALVMWAADVPLTLLARDIGETEAARRWRRVHRAVRDLAARIDEDGIDCDRIDRPELYLAGSMLDETDLRAEGEARVRAGLPSRFLNAKAVAARFDIAPCAALLSDASYEVDPVALTIALLRRARTRGAIIGHPVNVVRLEQAPAGRSWLHCEDGRRITARTVILAPGYERPTLFLPSAFQVGSSYAIATRPGLAPLWRENAMIWEASSPYLYARATADGRMIAGGEDEDFADARQRDERLGDKSGLIQAKLAAMVEDDAVDVDCAWSATFGSSPDGLPAIGRVKGRDGVWLASGFGGNGVSFAALAAEVIAADLAGSPDPDAECFDPYRFGA